MLAHTLEPSDLNQPIFPASSVQIIFSYFVDSRTPFNVSLLPEAAVTSLLKSSRRSLSLSLSPPLLNLSIHLFIKSAASLEDLVAVF
jgi:hypothetical protein